LRQRDPEVVRLHNSTAWKRLRELKRQQTPYCEICETQGRLVPVEQVDHIERVQDRPDLPWCSRTFDRSACPATAGAHGLT
jgi:hypothetical protein